MMWSQLTIRRLLTLVLILVSVVPVGIFTRLALVESSSILESEISLDVQVKSDTIMAEIDRMMFERSRNLSSWSGLEIMHELRLGDVDKRLSRFLFDLKRSYGGVYVEIHALDLQHHIVASSEPAQIGKTLTEMSQEQALLQNRYRLSTPIIDPITKQASGHLYAVLDWQQIIQLLNRSTLNHRSAALFDQHHQLIAASQYWNQYQRTASISSRAVSHSAQHDIPYQWQVVVAQPKRIAFAPINQLTSELILFVILLLVLVIISAIVLANSLSRPIRKLSQFTQQFNLQQEHVKHTVHGPKELKELAQAFDQMIVDLQKSQHDLNKAAKLAVVGELASAMSHEVRTPLGILKSSAQILLREQSLSAEGKEVCGFILSETERMNRLIDTLLDAGRNRPQECRQQDLVALTKTTLAMIAMQSKQQQLDIQLLADQPVYAYVDGEQITQVLLNLMMNAIQVIGKSIVLQLHIHSTAEYAVIEIADNGPGIPEDIRQQIFDPFFSQRKGGIGLGLAVVKKIINAHHGTIEVGTSALGGAVFRLQLPVEKTHDDETK